MSGVDSSDRAIDAVRGSFAVPARLRELRGRVLDFVEQQVYPAEPVLNRGETDPEALVVMRGLMDAAKAEGLWALGHPTELGGGGLSFLDYVHINEVVGRSEHARIALGTHSLQDAIMLHRHASREWCERYLRPLVAGEFMPSFAMTEPDVASSDPTQLQTTATFEDGYWTITGRKWFTSDASLARYTTVMARTEPDAPPHQAFSMLIVPTDAPGYRIVRSTPVLGMDGDHCEVRYDGVRVAADCLLGERGQGFRIAQERLGPGRIFHVMRFLGQAQRAFDLLCSRACAREAFGSRLADKQLVQQMVFDTAAEIQTVRAVTLEAAAELDRGGSARATISLIKVLGARMVHNAIDRAIQVHGALGLTPDTPLERMYRQARFARVYDGPDEVHIGRVARTLLKPYRAQGRWDFGLGDEVEGRA